MNRQPPAFLERLVARLIPAASREHVLGDLSERYRSPLQYFFDAARTLPFVIVGQLQRSRRAEVPFFQTAVLRIASCVAFLCVMYASRQLAHSVRPPAWFGLVLMLIMISYPVILSLLSAPGESLYGSDGLSSLSAQKQVLVRRMQWAERRLKVGAYMGISLSAAPFLALAAAQMSGMATPAFEGTFRYYSIATVLSCASLLVMERVDHRRMVRNLQQQLDNLQ